MKESEDNLPSSKKYDESNIKVITIDVERIKKRPHMYIGYSGDDAAKHLFKEVLQNSLDEITKLLETSNTSDSILNEVRCEYDEPNKVFTVIDNGRGIPHGSIIDVCTALQSSGKFEKGRDEAYDFASGLNGVGLTAVNALSTVMTVISKRDGQESRVVFKEGYVADHKVTNISKKEHPGTTIVFQPNENILGKIKLSAEPLMQLCNELSYLAKGVKIIFYAIKKGKDSSINTIFYSKNGIVDRLDMMSKAKVMKPIIIRNVSGDGNQRVEIALTYNPDSDTEEIVSYANFCTTIDHGTHVVGFRYGVSNALTRLTKEQMTERELKKLNITADDTKSGLTAVINFDHREPEFVGQVKERLSNQDALSYVRDVTYRGLLKYFNNNPKELKTVTDYIKTVAKIREAANKARKNTIRSSDINIFSDNRPKEYIPATGRKNLELFIIEGESAKGSGKLGRDQDHQALFALFGVPANTYDMSVNGVLGNKSLRDLITILGCNIGKNFDMDKLRFEKIIILSDSDTDGNKITALLAGFFLKHLPKIVETGRLYKAVPPLYSIGRGKNTRFLTDKKEYIDYLEKTISKNNTVYVKGVKLSDNELKDVLYINRRYLERLNNLSDRLAVNPTLLEYIILNIDKSNEVEKIKEYLSKNKRFRFLDISYNKSNDIYIKGLVDKEFQTLMLDESFWSKSKKLQEFIHKINNKAIFYKVNGSNVTLGEMLKSFDSYAPSYLQRFKGLGEMDGEELGATTMDPRNRTLYRLTSNDLKVSIDDFKVLQSTKAIEERKALIRSFEIDIEDLDT